MKAKVEPWGKYLRYNYVVADFSSVKDPGLYFIQYGDAEDRLVPDRGRTCTSGSGTRRSTCSSRSRWTTCS